MDTNGTHQNNTLQNDVFNHSIPRWGFDSHCNWLTAAKVDICLSIVAIIYNLITVLSPLTVSRMYCVQGAIISSYTFGACVVSIYSTVFDARVLIHGHPKLEHEGTIVYLLLWFLSYHMMFHMHLLSWDQHHRISQFKAHRRFTKRSKMVQLITVVWGSAIVFACLEGFFIHNLMHYQNIPQVSYFRLIIVLICMAFAWFGTLILIIYWNARVFCMLLKATHSGFLKKTPPEIPEQDQQELANFTVDPWNIGLKDDTYVEDAPEYATLPDNVKLQLSRSFANLVAVTVFTSSMIIWFAYHVLAIFRTAEVLEYYGIYDIIFCCELYLSLYTMAKVVLLLNPLWFFYYSQEKRNQAEFGIPHEIMND